MDGWPTSEPVESVRLWSEPLAIEHAPEMADVLAPPAIYEYTGGGAPGIDQLAERYARQTVGHSADGRQGWLNWVIRRRDTGEAIGFTQATLTRAGEGMIADIGWVVTPRHQGAGFASEAVMAMCRWLHLRGVELLVAYINPANRASIGVAKHLGMRRTDVVVDGEQCWECSPLIFTADQR